jgi:predicted lipoprotein with Yx(FWY)xxD motif
VQGLKEVVIDTIPAADGTHQLTVNGRPVYRYKDDNKPGDAFGQAVGSVWWTLDSAGNPVTTTAGGE